MRSCLQEATDESAFILQDVVNEFGRKLEFDVENGRYRGKKALGVIGFDGLWRDPVSGHGIVVEVKKTDAYNFNLDIQETYRTKLIAAGKISENSSILIVVGSENSGGIENAVLGSPYARRVRIVSAEALAKLVLLKLDGDPSLVPRIHDLFVPFPLVKLDGVIDIAFRAAEDAEASTKEEQGEVQGALPEGAKAEAKKQDRTPPEVITEFRGRMIDAFISLHGAVQKKSRAMYWSQDKKLRAIFAFSKQYEEIRKKGGYYYWFAYHYAWDQFLSDGTGFYVLGCFGKNEAYALPFGWIHSKMNDLDKTEQEDAKYCHVFICSTEAGGMALWLKTGKLLPVDEFRIALPGPVG